ncbi:aminopeptidase P family protein [Mycetocola zhadangensis]|uniref:Xaa-Pro aminopeptidase n=1 Tax=Mycetocola zhadangensis TaxID=1164595 RepID=A0A3L7J4U5_9MICO|nr:aminopeptidase P family protein [Mycetocola zhadangensis]RLQ85728.1 aminopeptidase P family protein [Mycetocola zhadangensis]GGE85256.1 Xaa-Pro aminopeptidase 1 [Mycetocola zhadangensis]
MQSETTESATGVAPASEETPSEETRGTSNRSTTPASTEFQEYIGSNWADRVDELPEPREQASFAARRRAAVSAAFAGKRVVVPAGSLKQRSNDTDYPFRAHSAFVYLTAWGADSEPDSMLVLEPNADGHDATVYFRERADRTSNEFYANPAIGEFWIGPRPSLAQVAADLSIHTAPLENFQTTDADTTVGEDDELSTFLSEMRLVKDDYEIEQIRRAVDATARGFSDVIADFPRITAHERGERAVEGVFYTRARLDGNAVGYDTIAASGPHACILHWTRNDGPVVPGDLMLLDAGVEVDSLYTADITRTLPSNGRFTDVQRAVYEAVREAADAAFAIVRPGIIFRDVHAEAMKVIAKHTAAWGMLPVSAEESLDPSKQFHRRYMVHGTSHHLGLDVHDCAQARREMYHDGEVKEGMVFTIEPGLYFQPDDLSVPEEFRGIGVRIEDDILVTATGAENLSVNIPRTADDVEAWIAGLQA